MNCAGTAVGQTSIKTWFTLMVAFCANLTKIRLCFFLNWRDLTLTSQWSLKLVSDVCFGLL